MAGLRREHAALAAARGDHTHGAQSLIAPGRVHDPPPVAGERGKELEVVRLTGEAPRPTVGEILEVEVAQSLIHDAVPPR